MLSWPSCSALPRVSMILKNIWERLVKALNAHLVVALHPLPQSACCVSVGMFVVVLLLSLSLGRDGVGENLASRHSQSHSTSVFLNFCFLHDCISARKALRKLRQVPPHQPELFTSYYILQVSDIQRSESKCCLTSFDATVDVDTHQQK